jgi:hypothetical protein
MKNNKLRAHKRQRYYSNSLFYRLAGRTAFLINLIQLSFVLLYVSGNYQSFLDSTQNTIIFISTLVCIPGIIFNIISLIMNIVYLIIYRRPVFILQLLSFLTGFIFQTAILIIFRLLNFISQGLS